MALRIIIENYVNQLPSRINLQEKKRIRNMLNNFFKRLNYLDNDINYILDNHIDFFKSIPDGISSYSRDKNKLQDCLMDFLSYFIKLYNIKIDINTYLPTINFTEKYERMIKILKYLHEGSKTQEEIAEHFDISTTSVKDDLRELQNGDYSFFDYKMQIDLNRKTNTYDSTIHPIFLPLNLSEVYALTVGLKLIGKGTAFNDIFDYISESIYNQLSEYGQKRIFDKAKEFSINFCNAINKEYRYEPDNPDKHLKQNRAQMIAYYLKSGSLCEIEYDSVSGIKIIIGKLSYIKSNKNNYNFKKILITSEKQEETEIDLSKIITIRFIT